MLSYYTKQNSLADQKNSIKNRIAKLYEIRRKMGLPGRHPANFARTKEKKTAITVVADAALLHRLMITRN